MINFLSSYLLRRLQTARTSCLPFNRFLQSHNSHTRFLKMPRDSRCPLYRTGCFQTEDTTVTKEFSKCHSWWLLCPFPRI